MYTILSHYIYVIKNHQYINISSRFVLPIVPNNKRNSKPLKTNYLIYKPYNKVLHL